MRLDHVHKLDNKYKLLKFVKTTNIHKLIISPRKIDDASQAYLSHHPLMVDFQFLFSMVIPNLDLN